MCQCRCINCNKCTTLMRDADTGGCSTGVGAESMGEISVLPLDSFHSTFKLELIKHPRHKHQKCRKAQESWHYTTEGAIHIVFLMNAVSCSCERNPIRDVIGETKIAKALKLKKLSFGYRQPLFSIVTCGDQNTIQLLFKVFNSRKSAELYTELNLDKRHLVKCIVS